MDYLIAMQTSLAQELIAAPIQHSPMLFTLNVTDTMVAEIQDLATVIVFIAVII